MKSMLSKKHLNEIQEKLVVMMVKRKWMKGITMAKVVENSRTRKKLKFKLRGK